MCQRRGGDAPQNDVVTKLSPLECGQDAPFRAPLLVPQLPRQALVADSSQFRPGRPGVSKYSRSWALFRAYETLFP